LQLLFFQVQKVKNGVLNSKVGVFYSDFDAFYSGFEVPNPAAGAFYSDAGVPNSGFEAFYSNAGVFSPGFVLQNSAAGVLDSKFVPLIYETGFFKAENADYAAGVVDEQCTCGVFAAYCFGLKIIAAKPCCLKASQPTYCHRQGLAARV
jgi:hypothetical protein